MGMVQHYPAVNRPATPVCSVCVANYNGAALLADCLDSVLAQVVDFSIEIIVHDDASTDDSLAILRENYPQVEVLASEKNAGFCVSNNRMAAHARGKYILLLNNDAALDIDAIATLLQEAESQQLSGILTLPQYDWESGALVDRGCLLDPFYNPIPNLDPARDDVAYVIGACLWCRRETWHALGGLPEWMESLAEDLYLCGVARLRGLPVRALKKSAYRHRQGASFGGNRAGSEGLRTSVKRRCLSERNKTRALIALTPSFFMWPLLSAHLVSLMLEGIALCLVRRNTTMWSEVYAPAITTPMRDFSLLRAARREQQNRRQISLSRWLAPVRWQLRKVSLLRRHGMPKID